MGLDPLGLENNKGADQPAHPRSLVSAFVIGLIASFNFLVTLCS